MSHDLLDRARAAASCGEFEEVRVVFGQVEPGALADSDREAWALVLAQSMLSEEARAVAARIAERPLREKVEAIVGGPGDPGEQPPTDDPLDAQVELRKKASPSDVALLASFLRFFGGRRDVYAKAWYDEKRRRSGYSPVEQPLTEAVARAHFEGRMTAGQYLLHPDGACSFGVIDLDLCANDMQNLKSAHGDDVSPLAHPGVKSFARAVVEAGAKLGIPLFVEDSGGRGAHAWVFFEPRKPARAVRALLGQLIAAAGPQPPGVGVEIYPKQDKLGPRGLSSLVKLPLGVHPATLRRCPLMDDLLRPIEDPAIALSRLRPAPTDAVDAVVGRRLVVLPAPELQRSETVPKLSEIPSARSLAEALRAIDAGEPSTAAAERVIRGCAILQSFVTKAYESHRLTADEARAILYTVGLIGSTSDPVAPIFAAARVSTLELDRVRRGLPSPAGCKRLQSLAPKLAAQCKCFGTTKPQPYATPALFAVGQVTPAEPRWKPFAPWMDADERVVADPLETLAAAIERIETRLERIEKPGTGGGEPKGG